MTKSHAAATLLAALLSSGCDPQPMDAAAMEDPLAEDEDGSDVEDDATEFENEPGPAFGALDGMIFTCSEAEDVYYQVVFEAGAIEVRDRDGMPLAQGTYATDDGGITLSVPALAFEERSVEHEIELDVVATFTTPSLFCHAVALDVSPDATSTILKCPDIRHIPSVSYEHHELHFWTDGSVKRRGWVELLDVNDTLYSEHWGIYLQLGDRVFMFFGDAKEDRFQTGTVSDEGVYVDGLEPESGPCE